MRKVVIFALLALISACSTAPNQPSSPQDAASGTGSSASTLGTLGTNSQLESASVASTSTATEAVDNGPFRLLFRDDFNAFEAEYWQAMTHSWPGNLALFSEDSVTVRDGQLELRLLQAPEGTQDNGEDKPFLGAEVRSKAALTYGRVRARIRFAKAPAVVSSLVTIYTPWPADNWNELDIEQLGQDPTQVQFNTMVYTGEPVTRPVTESVQPTADPHMEDLGFDSSAEFHDYTIEWTPEHATFWIDGTMRYEWTENIGLMTLPQNVLLTIWASDVESWAGAVAPETTGAMVTYDWVELWEYTGPVPAPTTEADATNTDPSTSASGASSTSTVPSSITSEVTSDSMTSAPPTTSEANATSGATSDSSDSLQLLFRDDFDEFDTSRWELMTHSWESNLALFSAESVTVENGLMTLTLLDAPSGTVDDTGASKSFLGAEVRSKQSIEFGRVKARAKFARGPGVVSSLVTIYTPWPADNWNELDIEHLGATPDQVQFNTMVYVGEPVVPPVTTSVTPTQFPQLVALGFDASAEFHEYAIEWTSTYVHFSVDGKLLHTFTDEVARLGLAQNVLLTIWASSSPEWAGAVTEETTGASAVYDWVEVYAGQ